jgi:small subunit ribosomal protein S20
MRSGGRGPGRQELPSVEAEAHYRKRDRASLPMVIDDAILMGSIRNTAPEFAREHHGKITHMPTASKAKKKTVRLASGRKRARQDVALNAANTALRSKFRTVVKNVQKALDKAATGGDKAAPVALFKTAQSVIDSIADKGIFHKNKAARHKSRLSAKIKAMTAAA